MVVAPVQVRQGAVQGTQAAVTNPGLQVSQLTPSAQVRHCERHWAQLLASRMYQPVGQGLAQRRPRLRKVGRQVLHWLLSQVAHPVGQAWHVVTPIWK